MGVIVGIFGFSGSGKSSAIRTLDPETTGIIQCIKKPLPFKEKFKNVYQGSNYKAIKASLKANNLKNYVIDDSSHLLIDEAFSRAKETQYGKFTDLAKNFKELIDCALATNDETIVYFLHHAQVEEITGFIRWQTLGKILSSWISPEAFITINIFADKADNKCFFRTQLDNSSTKTPIEMFEDAIIPNDLALIEKTVRNFYGI